ncbi:hypothetical protein BRC81_12125 [Halobacteriales archaeon QS_1_68_20]|nr:MAG: hypothetical protein BRC81_12125 [Halobacteriales archaeon QS_1_68_20]
MGSFEELGEDCARCDDEDAPISLVLFTEWTDHICAQHDVDVDRNLEAPLCESCYRYMKDMKNDVLSGRNPPDDVVVEANLDRLRVEALAEEQP